MDEFLGKNHENVPPEERANLNGLSTTEKEKNFLIIKEPLFPLKMYQAKKFSAVHFSPLLFCSIIE